MKGVRFFTFPSPVISDDNHPLTVKCTDWIKSCGQLNIDKIAADMKKEQLLPSLLKDSAKLFLFRSHNNHYIRYFVCCSLFNVKTTVAFSVRYIN